MAKKTKKTGTTRKACSFMLTPGGIKTIKRLATIWGTNRSKAVEQATKQVLKATR